MKRCLCSWHRAVRSASSMPLAQAQHGSVSAHLANWWLSTDRTERDTYFANQWRSFLRKAKTGSQEAGSPQAYRWRLWLFKTTLSRQFPSNVFSGLSDTQEQHAKGAAVSGKDKGTSLTVPSISAAEDTLLRQPVISARKFPSTQKHSFRRVSGVVYYVPP